MFFFSFGQDNAKIAVNRPTNSPSLNRRAIEPSSLDSPPSPRPPALPSRLRKPTSPQKSTPNPIPLSNGNVVRPSSGKAAPPPPPSSPPPSEADRSVALLSPRSSESTIVAKYFGSNNDSAQSTSRLPVARIGSPKGNCVPLLTSSPKLGARSASNTGGNLINVSIRSEVRKEAHNGIQTLTVDHLVAEDKKQTNENNGSLDSGSFEQDSLDGSTDTDLPALCSQSEETLNRIISRLSVPLNGSGKSDRIITKEENQLLVAARERLISESRQFVTASKMFVKSVTDSPQMMATCLNQCVTLVEQMSQAVEDLAYREQNRDLVPKVRDVARAFLHTLRSAADASGQGVNDPSMGRLMGKATGLAGVLTILMRSLRP